MNNFNMDFKIINTKFYSEFLIFLIVFFVKTIAFSENSIGAIDSSDLLNAPQNGQYYISNKTTNGGLGNNRVIAFGIIADEYAQADLKEQEKKKQEEKEKNKLCNKFSTFQYNNILLKTSNGDNPNTIQLTQLASPESPIYVFSWSSLTSNTRPENSNTELKLFIQQNNLRLFKVIDQGTQDPLDVIFLAQKQFDLQNYFSSYLIPNNKNWMTWINDSCFEGESYASLASEDNNLTGYLGFKTVQNFQSGATIWTGKDHIQPLGIMICKQKQLAGISIENTLTNVLSFEKISSGTIVPLKDLTSAISEASTLQSNTECEY